MNELFDTKKLGSFWPTNSQTSQEKVASSIRFVVYTTLIVFLLRRDSRIIVLGLGICFILYSMYNNGMIKSTQSPQREYERVYVGREWDPKNDGTYFSQHNFFDMPENNLDAFLKGAYPDMFRPRCRDDTASCDPDMRSEWIQSRGPPRRNNGLY